MITDFLLEHRWLMPAVLAVLVLGGPPVAAWLAGRRRLLWSLTGLSLLPVAALTLTPVDRELYGTCEIAWMLPTPARVELFANLVLFVAPVLLAGVATRRPIAVLVAASALSAVIEGVQALAPAIGRSCDTTDWLSNTIGAMIGAALAAIALRRGSASSARATPRR